MASPWGDGEHGRPVAERTEMGDHASGRKAARAHAESGRRRRRYPNAVTSDRGHPHPGQRYS